MPNSHVYLLILSFVIILIQTFKCDRTESAFYLWSFLFSESQIGKPHGFYCPKIAFYRVMYFIVSQFNGIFPTCLHLFYLFFIPIYSSFISNTFIYVVGNLFSQILYCLNTGHTISNFRLICQIFPIIWNP